MKQDVLGRCSTSQATNIQQLQIYVPAFRKSTAPSLDPTRPQTPSPSRKPETIHRKSYTFIGFNNGCARLMAEDLRVSAIPEDLVPITLPQGSSLVLTIAVDKKGNAEKAREMVEWQRGFMGEQDGEQGGEDGKDAHEKTKN